MSGVTAVDFDQLLAELWPEVTGWTGVITPGRSRAQVRWDIGARWELSMGALLALVNPALVPVGERTGQSKDGPCFVPWVIDPWQPGSLVSHRHKNKMRAASLLVIDCDAGTELGEVVRRLKYRGVGALVVPTWSHRAREGEMSLPRRLWADWLDVFGSAEAVVLNRLCRGFLPRVVEQGLDGPVVVEDGGAGPVVLRYRLAAGVPRWRIYLPLAEAWLAEDGPGPEAAKAWEDAYLRALRWLGFWDADPSCKDASRLYYDRRWPRGWLEEGWRDPDLTAEAPFVVVPGAVLTLAELGGDGALPDHAVEAMTVWLNLREAAEAEIPRTTPRLARTARVPHYEVTRPDGVMVDLTRWRNRCGHALPLVELLEQRRPDLISSVRGQRDGNLHICCPRFMEHSDLTDRGGTFVADSDGLVRARTVCMHSHGAGMRQEEWLAIWLEEGVLTWDDLDRIEVAAIAAEIADAPADDAVFDGLLPGITGGGRGGDGSGAGRGGDGSDSRSPLELNPNDPMAAARLIMRRFWTQEDDHTLIEYQSICYSWLETHYRPWSKREFNARVWRILEEAWKRGKDKDGNDVLVRFQPNTKTVANVEAALRAVALVPDRIRPPAWLAGGHEHPAHELIALENGVLHWPTRTLLEATPRLFSVNCLPFAYDPKAPEPVAWLRFLHQLWPHDQSSIDALQEMFGYILSGDTSQQKAFLMLGPPRSGRGTIARVLAALLGKDAVVGSSLEELGSPFGLENLIDKQLAILGDIREASKPDYGTAVERVLGITGEDIMGVRRKGIASWSGQLLVRFLMLANEVPPLPDTSGALLTRLLVWNLTESWAGREDTELTETLLRELAGILNWALRGADRLRQVGRFTIPGSGQTVIGEIQRVLSPVRAFVDDCCLEVPDLPAGEAALCASVFQVWRQWCSTNNLRRGMYWTPAYFSIQLRAVLPRVVVIQPRSGVSEKGSGVSEKGSGVSEKGSGVSNPRRYAGLKLRKIGPDKLDV